MAGIIKNKHVVINQYLAVVYSADMV